MYVIDLLKDSSILIDGNKVVDSSTVEQHVVPDASYNVFSSVTVNPYELDSKTVDSSTVSQTVTSDKDGLSSVTVNPYELDQKTVDSSTNSQVITSDKDGLSQVTVNPYELDSKTVDSSTNSQTIVSDKDGLSEVVINPYTLDSKTVDSSTNSQVVLSSKDGLSSVTVNPYVLDSSSARLTENGNYSFTSDEDGLSRVDVEVDVNLNIQSKTVDPSTNSQVVSPDEGYNALSQVTVNAVDASIDSNITPQNIVIGKTILGVTGIANTVVYPSIVTKQIKRYDKIYCPTGVFFNTGVIPGTVGDHVTVEVEGTLDGDGGFTHGFSEIGTGNCYYRFFSLNSTVYFDLTASYSDRINYNIGNTVNTSHVYKFGCEDVNGTKQVLYIDGTLRASKTQSGTRTLNCPIGLFGYIKPDGTYDYSGGSSTNKYLKWAKIYRGDELLKEYYPVVDDEDNPCLYDVVNNEYVYPLGDATISLGTETTPIEVRVEDWSTSNLQRKTVDSSTELQTVTFDSSYVALYDVKVNPYTTEDKTVDPSTNDQTVTATGADALGTVTVKKYKVQPKSVDPSTNSQIVNPDPGYQGLSQVTVRPYVLDSSSAVITDNGNYSFLPTHNGLSRVDVSVNVDSLVPESIIVDPSTNQQVITPSQGYTGITQVTVNPYVLDQKSTTITQNGSYVLVSAEDGMSRVDISVNVEGGGSVVMQSKVVDPSSGQLSVTPDDGYTGLSEVTVNAVATESKTVDASTNQQIIEPGQGYAGLSQVTVNAVTSSIDSNITPGNIRKNVTILGVTGTVEESSDIDNDALFIDFDGNVLYSYTKYEFLQMNSLPPLPVIEGYTSNSWNLTLEEAIDALNTIGYFISVLFMSPSDGKIHLKVEITDINDRTVSWYNNIPRTVEWGDGEITTGTSPSHTYAELGTYEIKIDGATEDDGTSISYTYNTQITEIHLVNILPPYLHHSYPRLRKFTYGSYIDSGSMLYSPYLPVLYSSRLKNDCKYFIYNNKSNYTPNVYSENKVDKKMFYYDALTTKDTTMELNLSDMPKNSYFDFSCLKSLKTVNVTVSNKYIIKRFYSIKFPDTVTTIQSTDALAYITYMYATTPPTLSSISNKTGTDVQLIYVPNGCLEAYQTATNWSNYASKMVEMPA